MKKALLISLAVFTVGFAFVCSAAPVIDAPAKERCPVCGMFVEKYKPWLAQIQMSDGKTYFFDGVKDMMAFYFQPDKYGAPASPKMIYVKSYYTQQWIEGRAAVYVSGSDVMGPMGHEFIPFEGQDQAAAFKEDHSGKEVLEFEELTLEKVDALRSGVKEMKMHKMKKKNSS